jgi:predicted PurR-regulated permease PerM
VIAGVSSRTAARLVLVVLLTTLAFLLGLWLLYQLQSIVVWSILALFAAVALSPTVNWLHGRGVPRAVAILLSYLVVVIVVAAIAALVVPSLFQQATGLIRALHQAGGLGAEVDRYASPLGLGSFVTSLRPQLDALPGQLAGSIGSFTTVTASTLSTITAILSVAVLAFFFLHDGTRLIEASVRLLPDAHQPRARRLIEGSEGAISGYIRGNLAISAIAGVSALAGMLVLGIPYALPLAVLLAVLDLVPMVGATLGAIPVVLAALAISPVKALIMLVYIIVYQQIESNVLNPLIYGRSDQLPALTVFLAFLAGSLLWGILGALIAIPVANIIRIVIREWLASRAAPGAAPADTMPGSSAPLPGADRAQAE